MTYIIQFQAFDSELMRIGTTDDLAFARQIMLAAYAKLGTSGQCHIVLGNDWKPVQQTVYEPVIALYEQLETGSPRFIESIGWAE